jgi:hypothetical protein
MKARELKFDGFKMKGFLQFFWCSIIVSWFLSKSKDRAFRSPAAVDLTVRPNHVR